MPSSHRPCPLPSVSTATMSTKGQVTIPVDLRRRLGLESGDRVAFVEFDGAFAIKPANDDVRSLKGLLRKPEKPVTVEDMNVTFRAHAMRQRM